MSKTTLVPLWDFRPFRSGASLTTWQKPPGRPGEVFKFLVGFRPPEIQERYQPTDTDISTINAFSRQEKPSDPNWLSVRAQLVSAGVAPAGIEALTIYDLLAVISSTRPATMSADEAAKKWGMDKGNVIKHCQKAGRVPGAAQDEKKRWRIPADAPRPKGSLKAPAPSPARIPRICPSRKCDYRTEDPAILECPECKKIGKSVKLRSGWLS